MVWYRAVPRYAGFHSFCGGGFCFLRSGGGTGYFLFHVHDSDLHQLFHYVYEYIHAPAGQVLPSDRFRAGRDLYFSGIPDRGRRYEIHSHDRSNTSVHKLWRKFGADHAGDVFYHRRIVYHQAGRRRKTCQKEEETKKNRI